jgi:hypothetical protein
MRPRTAKWPAKASEPTILGIVVHDSQAFDCELNLNCMQDGNAQEGLHDQGNSTLN